MLHNSLLTHLNLAFNKFFRDLKQGKLSYPKFKKKKDNQGSFYLGGDIIKFSTRNNKTYLKIPNLGKVRLREKLRFNGTINSATISQKPLVKKQINIMLLLVWK